MDDDSILPYLLCAAVWFFICGFIGSYLGHQKGRSEGFILGALLGPIGWIIVLLLPEEGVHCGACHGVVPRAATRCKHCGSSLELSTTREKFNYAPMDLRELDHPKIIPEAAMAPMAPPISEYIDVSCPDCSASLSVKKDSLARGVNCPMCQTRFALKV